MSDIPYVCKTLDLAAAWGVTDRQTRRILKEIGVQPLTRDKWPLLAVCSALREQAQNGPADGDLLYWRTQKMKLEAMRLAEQLVMRETVISAMQEQAGVWIQQLEALPAMVSNDPAIQEQVRGHIHATRRTVAGLLESWGATPPDRTDGDAARGAPPRRIGRRKTRNAANGAHPGGLAN